MYSQDGPLFSRSTDKDGEVHGLTEGYLDGELLTKSVNNMGEPCVMDCAT